MVDLLIHPSLLVRPALMGRERFGSRFDSEFFAALGGTSALRRNARRRAAKRRGCGKFRLGFQVNQNDPKEVTGDFAGNASRCPAASNVILICSMSRVRRAASVSVE